MKSKLMTVSGIANIVSGAMEVYLTVTFKPGSGYRILLTLGIFALASGVCAVGRVWSLAFIGSVLMVISPVVILFDLLLPCGGSPLRPNAG